MENIFTPLIVCTRKAHGGETNIKNKYGLTANILKMTAVAAMLIDHIAYKFLSDYFALSFVMRLIGRLTAPIMCYFIAEGYYHTKNIKKYILRMSIFAIISHFAYVYFTSGELPAIVNDGKISIITDTSVIYTLLMGLIALIVWDSLEINVIVKAIVILAVCVISDIGDWGITVVLWILLFGIYRGDFKKQMIGFLIAGIPVWLFPIMSAQNDLSRIYMTCNFGIYLVIPLLYLYNGKLGKLKNLKWVFYIFYPLHMFIIGLLYYKIL